MSRRNGLTLVELLVVIAVIGVLIALLLPAVQSAREQARVAQCKNQLRQMGLAALNHVTAHGHFPSGGWGASWTGDPDRGFGPRQPGGWVFNTLPYLEEGSTLRVLGSNEYDAAKRRSLARAMQTPLAIFHCPSRRAPRLYPYSAPYTHSNADTPEVVARSDYAINAGAQGSNTIASSSTGIGGPLTLEEGDTTYAWQTVRYNGVSFLRSRVRPAQVTDGMSATYLAGEKYLDLRHYETGQRTSDRGHLLIGFAPDTVRLASVWHEPAKDRAKSSYTSHERFGSAHASGCQLVLCDGSVRLVSYEMDVGVHHSFGARDDGSVVR